MYPSSSEGLNKETDQAVYFFTPAFHVFDNFSAHRVELWGKVFPTAEHAFQWKKFSESRSEIAEEIFNAGSPEMANRIAKANREKRAADWDIIKVGIMEQIFRAKFEQNEDVKEVLKKSANRTIIENSPIDDFWGIGPNGNGKNMVGKIWMKIRQTL